MTRKGTINSLTPLAKQRNWSTPADFPRCPQKIVADPLYDYGANLECGCIFFQNYYSEAIVDTYGLSEDRLSLSVICNLVNGVKEWSVTEVVVEDRKFIHISRGTFFEFDAAKKAHYAVLGKLREREMAYDDYC